MAYPTILPNGEVGLAIVQSGQVVGGINVTQLLTNAVQYLMTPKSHELQKADK